VLEIPHKRRSIQVGDSRNAQAPHVAGQILTKPCVI
jgi:hypothetical protein